MTKRWRIRAHDAERIAALQREARVPAVVAQLLAARGLCDAQAIKKFLEPKLMDLREPDELPGVADAAGRLIAAVRERRPIVVYGDYDADGITGAALLYECLTLLGGKSATTCRTGSTKATAYTTRRWHRSPRGARSWW